MPKGSISLRCLHAPKLLHSMHPHDWSCLHYAWLIAHHRFTHVDMTYGRICIFIQYGMLPSTYIRNCVYVGTYTAAHNSTKKSLLAGYVEVVLAVRMHQCRGGNCVGWLAAARACSTFRGRGVASTVQQRHKHLRHLACIYRNLRMCMHAILSTKLIWWM